ncbi:uncharacterized protein HD556DRAFT_264414 [Suillus plorans]|uniref:Uncharacterized protein n=1 Tax=Suillus plorans TaxID=116603 RepID=A0A9P7DKC0_9AGAM|nr:uncharacterized protein HD556DRAFT_264414 [Suillus plorans]KAG1796979.1 hypothetical protein HD556DRAFT_264414 [Suillus plorans]
MQLWNVETNQPIGTPLHGHIYMWDVSAILKEAGLPGTAPKLKGAPRIPPGFFDDALREANLRIRLSQSHGPHGHSIPVPRQRTLSRFPSFWRRSKSHGETGHHTRPRSHPLSWTRNLVSGILRRRDGSDMELREVEVPYTAGKEIITLERSQLPARLDLPKSMPRNHHSYPLHRRIPPSLVPPLRHQEHPRVLISPVLDGALVSWAGFAVCLFRTQTVTISEATLF